MKTHHYMVNAPSPMFLLRLPFPAPAWKDIRKALSPDPAAVFKHLHDVRDDEEYVKLLEAAFAGGGELPGFTLYDWRDGGFVLVRGGT